MAQQDVKIAEVRVSTATGAPFGTWTSIANLTSFRFTSGNTGEDKTYVFGSATAITRAGDLTEDVELSGLFDPDDTNGQDVLRSSRDNDTRITLALLWDNTGAAEEGAYITGKVTEYSQEADRDGTYSLTSLTFSGDGTRTEFTGGMPT